MNSSRQLRSSLARQTQALILAGGRGARLKMLTDWRAKPAVPFGGQFQVIDFALSNCLHSDVRRIAVLTQYKSHSLMRHLMLGWNRLNSEYGGLLDLIPAQQWLEDETWYQGTADAVYQSLDIIGSHDHKYFLVLAGDQIYTMDYGVMLDAHAGQRADITVACNKVPLAEASQFGVMEIDHDQRVVGFEEKPAEPKPMPDDPEHALVSMGIYVFSSGYLRRTLTRDAEDHTSSHDFGNDVIPHAVQSDHNVQAVLLEQASPGRPYWRDVGTLDAFFQANLELLADDPVLDLYDQRWPIFTRLHQSPPAKFCAGEAGRGCNISASAVSIGCVVTDSVLHRVMLGSDCRVDSGCRLEQVVALPNCHIEEGCRLTGVLVDNGCQIPAGTIIGEDRSYDEARFYVTEEGVVVVNREMLGQKHRYQPVDPPHLSGLH
ncbi:MAG: glucose-1-phosphate adenylyltransferase [Wenzhouxiangella sp.]